MTNDFIFYYDSVKLYVFTYHLSLIGTKPKIFAVHNFDKLCKPKIYYDNVNLIFNNLSQNDGIFFVSNFNFIYLKSYPKYTIKSRLNLIKAKIILQMWHSTIFSFLDNEIITN